MKEITSRKTRKIQIISDSVWNDIVRRGWATKFIVHEAPVRQLKQVPVIKPAEIVKTEDKWIDKNPGKKATTKKKKDG